MPHKRQWMKVVKQELQSRERIVLGDNYFISRNATGAPLEENLWPKLPSGCAPLRATSSALTYCITDAKIPLLKTKEILEWQVKNDGTKFSPQEMFTVAPESFHSREFAAALSQG